MTIETNLNQSPYFDDFTETKRFHRILFRPGRAVQARELTQLQTILQNQIERFANEVLVDGTVVTGVGLTTRSIDYVKLRDKDANNRVMLLTDFFENGRIANVVITGATSGMTARLVDAKEGSEAAAPNYLSLFVQYTNAGSNNTTRSFINNEVLVARRTSNNEFIVAANTITSNATGLGFRALVTDGIIYHKGHFIKVTPQSTIVDRYSTVPSKKIGFETIESTITADQDSSLNDNATGSSNANAPGADRLKLLPTLTSRPLNVANTTTFFTIATLENGNIVEKNTDTVYSDIGDLLASRSFETSGNYAIEPFNVRIREHLKSGTNLGRYDVGSGGDPNKLAVEVERGIGYVGGKRIQLNTTVTREVDKATDYEVKDARVVGQAFGHYVYADEVVGTWDFQGLRQVSLRDSAQAAITNKNFGATAAQGSEIGTAHVRGIQYHSGTPGTVAGRFRIYLFDIQMNSGSSFADVRGLHITNASGPNSLADIVLESSGVAKIQEAGLNSLVFPFTQKGTKTLRDASNNVDTQFVFRTEKTVNFTTSGTATVTSNTAHAGGTETMNDTGSPLTNNDERNIIVVARQTVNTAPHTGTVTAFSGNTITGSGTTFNTSYQIGDIIAITDGANTVTERITDIPTSTSIEVANDIGYTRSGVTLAHKTTFPTGYIFDTSANGTITSTSSQHQINLQQSNLATIFTASVYFDRLRSSAIQTAKTVNKDKFIHINTGSHTASSTGPWPLGVSDAYKLVAVYKGANTSVTTSDNDVTEHFELDTGQKDGFYGTSYLRKKSTSSLDVVNAGLMVKFNYFGRDRSAGIGFLSVDSYPIDDTNTANTTAITTQEIPVFESATGRVKDLRDSIDFRPIKENSVTPSSTGTVAAAPTNPSANNSYNIDSDGAYIPTPDQNFQADVQFYLPRKDRIVITQEGNVEVVKGVPSIVAKSPPERAGAMTLAVLNIPVYPSLSAHVAKQINRQDYRVGITVENNRRYTMRDLRAIEKRVKNLEYYSALNVLEASALNKQLFNSSGLDRFKNGLLVDSFNGHNIADRNKVGYKAAIDINRAQLRPTFKRQNVPMTKDNSFTSSNVVKTGDLITLSYSNTAFQTQPYASKQRNPTQELSFNWRGEIILAPSTDNTPDITTGPDIQVDFGGIRSSAEQVQTSGIEWGSWETTYEGGIESLQNIQFNDFELDGGTARHWQGEEQIEQTRVGIQTIVTPVVETHSIGNFVTDVSVREFMRSRVIRFSAIRMKPNTRVYPYFDEERVSEYVTPTNSSFVATGIEGANVVTDNSGNAFGLFRIPNDSNLKFRIGTRRFELKDIANTVTQTELLSTSAHGDYTSSGIQVTQRGATATVTTYQTSTVEVVDVQQSSRTITHINPQIGAGYDYDKAKYPDGKVGSYYDYIADPLAQTFTVAAGEGVEGIFMTRLGLFFAQKSSTFPISIQIREVQNGIPTQDIVPYGTATLNPSQITANSTVANVESQFVFNSPVFLKNNTDYAMVILPAGNVDDYSLWVAELGAQDVDTEELIDKQPATGVMLTSANDKTWSPIQSEDLKYTIYRASFSTSPGTVYIENDDQEFFDVDNFNGTFRVGENVSAEGIITLHGVTGNTSAISVGNIISNTNGSSVSNGTIRSIINDYANGTIIAKIDPYNTSGFATIAAANGQVSITGSQFTNGNAKVDSFTANSSTAVVEFVNISENLLNATDSTGNFANGWIRGQSSGASARVIAANNAIMNSLVPKIASLSYANTTSTWAVRTTSTSGVISTTWQDLALDTENSFIDGEKKVYGKTNETSLTAVNGSKKSLVIRGTLRTQDNRMSPVIDDSRSTGFLLENVINNNSTDEHKEVGSSLVRYISTPVILDDGQEAEDLIVYLTAYKPQGTDIKVYARILNPEDAENFEDKDYSPLRQVTASNTYSDSVDTTDTKEFEFTFSANTNGQGFLSTSNSHAYLNTANNNVVAYKAADGSIHHTYKTFAIKIVLTSTGTSTVPLVNDMRALALQK